MRAAVASETGTLSVQERERPEPGPDEVLVEVAACGLCGGDRVVLDGADGVEYPRVPGHEVAGRVAATGPGVGAWEPGERVAVGWHGGHCFECDRCRRGAFTTCRNKRVTGLTRDGGLATATLVRSEALVPVPDEIEAVAAGPLVCAGLTAYNALRDADAAPGDRVAIQGIGGVGHVGLQVADAMGFETVAVSRGTAKRSAALELGADAYVDAEAVDPATALRDRGGAAAILATAPNADAIASLVGGLAPEGELVVVGVPPDPIAVDVGPLVDQRLSVRGWSSGHPGDASDLFAFAVRNDVAPRVETVPLSSVEKAVDRFEAGPRFRVVVEP